MDGLALLMLAVALAMDAFAVAVVVALSLDTLTRHHLFRLSFHFGLFQALMLAVGWLLGSAAAGPLAACDHWVAFALLAFVGARAIRNATCDEPETVHPDRTRGWDLVMLSVATSIDALAVGLSLALIDSAILLPAAVVGGVAATLTLLGMAIGRRVGMCWGRRVEVLGGLILIAIGLHIVWDHLGA